MQSGYLLLQSGDVFCGQWLGAVQQTAGELVFNTSMTGYQEIITDPSYAGQIVTFSYPLIGNYGWNDFDDESARPHLAALIVGEMCDLPSHYLASTQLQDRLQEAGIACLTGVDTRAVVRTIRRNGAVQGLLMDQAMIDQWSGQVGTDPSVLAKDASFWNDQEFIPRDSLQWVTKVAVSQVTPYKSSTRTQGVHIVLVDYGFKKSIADSFIERGCQVTIVPFTYTLEQIRQLNPDGVVFSNGPGDPLALTSYLAEIKKISSAYPSLGICLGHQLLALAHGAKTSQLKYGHRGSNHPVKEIQTGQVMITPQNHSYVVTAESIDPSIFEITYRHVNDQSIEGLRHRQLPVHSVQFHPEAHAGPADTGHIFNQFIQEIVESNDRLSAGDFQYAMT